MPSASRAAIVAVLAAAVLGCSPGGGVPGPRTDRPALVLLVTVDQFPFEYLDRYPGQYQGGLARLRAGGAVFTDAHHDHAITETAPGHATLLSGRFPSHTGITRNLAGVNDTDAPLIGARDLGASPRRFRGTTLFDWLQAADPGARALSLSSKDRSAILPVGRSKQQVYWYADNGTFTTSNYYRDTLPDWVRDFNARRLPHQWAGRAWTLLRDEGIYSEPDSVVFEGGGRNYLFPHRFPTDSNRAATQVRYSPIIDELTLGLALEGVRTLGIGTGPDTDLLAISLSGTDYVGHMFGPESREQHDNLLRLDRVLGAFLDTLYTLRDSSRIVIVMSSDHGVAPIPELHGKLRVRMDGPMSAMRAMIRAAGGDTTAIDFESGAFFVDAGALGGKGLSADEVTTAFMEAARQVAAVDRVDRFRDLPGLDQERDPVARRWIHMFPPDIAPTAVVTLGPGHRWDYPTIATHGSPYDYDSHVPLIFYGPGFATGRFGGRVRTVDLAPTLARRLGIQPLEPIDGRVLDRAFP